VIAVIARNRKMGAQAASLPDGSLIEMSKERHQQLSKRSKDFALRVIRMSQALPRGREANVILQQVLRSATSMAANYRAAGRSRSKAEFIAKIGVVVEEADETVFWLEMLADSGIVRPAKLQNLLVEATQLVAIFTASRKTARE
jgi:four helix bundle protein